MSEDLSKKELTQEEIDQVGSYIYVVNQCGETIEANLSWGGKENSSTTRIIENNNKIGLECYGLAAFFDVMIRKDSHFVGKKNIVGRGETVFVVSDNRKIEVR